tara:strand:- start:1930 stop:2655 length:726 start_codon:yes stop_codon:yes gene_type:complete
MNIDDLEHIAIRSQQYITGSAKQPTVDLFIQTHMKRAPLNDSKLIAGQTIWMKWSGGPIVARTKLLSWTQGHFENGNINEMRNSVQNTSLFSSNSYWESVAEKRDAYYTIVFLKENEGSWIDSENLIYPGAKSVGPSWVYLDTNDKKKLWLTNNIEQQLKENNPKGRGIPAGLKYKVRMRDNNTCQVCGKRRGEEYPDLVTEVDHITPWSKLKVKEHTLDNLQVLCWEDNRGKSNNRDVNR